MTKQADGLPRTFSAGEVATALDCSEWWVKEQARRRRIPFIRSGSGYRFTKSHVDEIFHLLEERPEQGAVGEPTDTARRHSAAPAAPPVVQLRARRPRRAARKAA